MVSIITNIGIKGIGVPCGKKWARDAFVLCRKPLMTVAAQSGIAIPKFIDSCVVGVNEWGSRPNRLVEPMNRISEISMRDQVRPFVLWIDISCFRIN